MGNFNERYTVEFYTHHISHPCGIGLRRIYVEGAKEALNLIRDPECRKDLERAIAWGEKIIGGIDDPILDLSRFLNKAKSIP
ncbi:hypothetical protein HYX17_05330 [Candidatus Woesearchaeota archaeon]|nr:hypothetical protein [Candidatus Woesearchaeota archaeon]